jgi:hypothetical protein
VGTQLGGSEQVAQEATRRGVLATGLTAAGLAATGLPMLAGCKGIGALGTPPTPLPDVAIAAAAIAGERALIARYDATLRALPGLAGQLRPLLAQHNEHLARLHSRLSDPSGKTGPTRPGGTNTGGTSTAASGSPPVPATPAAALASLRTAENNASAALAGRLPSVSPSFAQLLASISASEATHALLLHPRGHAQ